MCKVFDSVRAVTRCPRNSLRYRRRCCTGILIAFMFVRCSLTDLLVATHDIDILKVDARLYHVQYCWIGL